MGRVSSALGRLLPRSARRALRRRLRDRRKARSIRTPDLGDLRRTEPISRTWGADRGRPVDRYYIDSSLEAHRADIRGHVLEILLEFSSSHAMTDDVQEGEHACRRTVDDALLAFVAR